MSSDVPARCSALHPEVVRLVASFLAEGIDWNDDVNRWDQEDFAFTCKLAYETLKPELDWLVEVDKQVWNENAMSHHDFDAGTDRQVSCFWDLQLM